MPARSPRSMSRLRACWAVHAPVGCSVTPRMCTRRVSISITKKTYRRLRNTVSACRKSHDRTPDAWEVRNCLWVPTIPSPHATCEYSWIRPLSRSRWRTRMLSSASADATAILASGGLWPRARCGRWVL